MSLPLNFLFGPPAEARPIFFVDDNENDRVLFLHAMEDAGVRNPVRVFATGDEMIEALIAVLQGATLPFACFMDVKMAGTCGLDVLRWIRLQDHLAQVPVIMVSSSQDPGDLADALNYGAQCYVEKFPQADQLRALLAEADKFSSVASGRSSFSLSCNLLPAAQPAAS